MGQYRASTQANPSAPAAGTAIVYPNTTNLEWTQEDANGKIRCLRVLTNAGVTTTNGADIYIVGSNITVPPQLAQIGAQFMWTLNMSKSAACTSAPIYNIRVGTAGAIGDVARLTFTSAQLQTAALDNAILQIVCQVTTAGASGVINGGYQLGHKNATTGFCATQMDAQGPTASGAFDLTVANLVFGLSINPGNTGANAVWTIQTYTQGFNL